MSKIIEKIKEDKIGEYYCTQCKRYHKETYRRHRKYLGKEPIEFDQTLTITEPAGIADLEALNELEFDPTITFIETNPLRPFSITLIENYNKMKEGSY